MVTPRCILLQGKIRQILTTKSRRLLRFDENTIRQTSNRKSPLHILLSTITPNHVSPNHASTSHYFPNHISHSHTSPTR
ncbi:hypothetical protein HID58_009944 [Brassica napus]|uniref:Uncharacterized protein n=1 Tax=Brassica napus TaxID=3708 RepID=A0ABQ8DUP8_BRANA|nr:hypothetical protein HID58_009944 [Brassica napus]